MPGQAEVKQYPSAVGTAHAHVMIQQLRERGRISPETYETLHEKFSKAGDSVSGWVGAVNECLRAVEEAHTLGVRAAVKARGDA